MPQLEELCISLGIRQHIPALSGWRDDLLRTTAASLQEKDATTAAALQDKDDTMAAALQEKNAAITATAAKLAHLDAIAAVLADPAKNDAQTMEAIKEAVAASGLSDVQLKIAEVTKQRDELTAQLAELSAMLDN